MCPEHLGMYKLIALSFAHSWKPPDIQQENKLYLESLDFTAVLATFCVRIAAHLSSLSINLFQLD